MAVRVARRGLVGRGFVLLVLVVHGAPRAVDETLYLEAVGELQLDQLPQNLQLS